MTSITKQLDKLSVYSTVMLVVSLAMGLTILTTPQYPVDVTNPWIYGTFGLTALLIFNDFNK